MEKSRWSWKKIEGNSLDYFNALDFRNNKKFCIRDDQTGTLYILETILDPETKKPKYIHIPESLRSYEFYNWAISTAHGLIKYLSPELLTPLVIRVAVNIFEEFPPKEFGKLFTFIPLNNWCEAIKTYPELFEKIPNKYMKIELVEAYASTKNPKYELILPRFRSKELFERMFYNNDNPGKIRMINLPKGISFNRYPKHYYDSSFITIDMAKELLKIDSSLKIYIPLKILQAVGEESKENSSKKDNTQSQSIRNSQDTNSLNSNIPGFFNNPQIRNILNAINIYTIKEFLRLSNTPEFLTYFGTSPYILKDIYATIKLLRCKYLDEDPLIELDDMTMDEFIKKFGFSFEIEKALIPFQIYPHFFDMLFKMSFKKREEYLRNNTSLDNTSIEEIIYRTQIVIDYNANKESPDNKKTNELLQEYGSLKKRFFSLQNATYLLSNQSPNKGKTGNQ